MGLETERLGPGALGATQIWAEMLLLPFTGCGTSLRSSAKCGAIHLPQTSPEPPRGAA